MKIANIKRRVVNNGLVLFLGVESDNLVENVIFTGIPAIGDAQLVSLHWALDDGTVGDIVELTQMAEGYSWNVGNNITQYGGKPISAYIRITIGDETTPRWSTRAFNLAVYSLPVDSAVTAILKPSVIDSMSAEIAENKVGISAHTNAMNNNLSLSEAAKEAAAESAGEAEEYANAAYQSKVSAADSEQVALGKAEEARDSALVAQGKEEEASEILRNVQALAIEVEDNTSATDRLRQEVAADKETVDTKTQQVQVNTDLVSGMKDVVLSARDQVVEDKDTVSEDKEQTRVYKEEAGESAGKAKASELNAETSERQSTQNLSDLLNIAGDSLATLIGGKVPVDQIPAVVRHDIVEIQSEADLLTIDAQKGDVAVLVSMNPDTGSTVIKLIEKSFQLLGEDSTVLSNWAVTGTSYALTSAYATTAKDAENAGQINGHRIVLFTTVAEMESAVKADDDLYFAPYDV